MASTAHLTCTITCDSCGTHRTSAREEVSGLIQIGHHTWDYRQTLNRDETWLYEEGTAQGNIDTCFDCQVEQGKIQVEDDSRIEPCVICGVPTPTNYLIGGIEVPGTLEPVGGWVFLCGSHAPSRLLYGR